MMTKMTIKKEIAIYLILDFILLLFSAYKGLIWVVNSQSAFISSLSVILLSYLSYYKNISKKVQQLNENSISDRDFIDEMDDPYELYDDETNKEKPSKTKITIKNLSKTKGAALSIYRIVGYLIVIAFFMTLVRLKLFSILPYILGISVIPIGTLFLTVFLIKRDKK